MQGELRIMDRSGHTVKSWDTEVTEGPLSTEYVEQEFDRLVKGGYLGFTEVKDPETGKRENVQIRKGEFDPEQHEKVTLVPPFVGG